MSNWNQALAEYQRLTTIVSALDGEKDEAAFDAAADDQSTAIEALIAAPTPDLAGLAVKLQIMQRDGYQHRLASVIADVERLKATGNDAIILAAFAEWKAARELIAESEDEEADKVQWAIVDRAEKVICTTPATSKAAAETVFWLALDHEDDNISYEVRQQDLAALLTLAGLSWRAKLIARGIANLRALVAEA